MSIYQVESNPNRGLERYLNIEVVLTDEFVPFDVKMLDKIGRRKFKAFVMDNFSAVRGIASINWKSKEDRTKCIENQIKRGRWNKVTKYKNLIVNGKWNKSKLGPVYIHPSFTNSVENKLKPIDGARRIMAHIEANKNSIGVVVVKNIS